MLPHLPEEQRKKLKSPPTAIKACYLFVCCQHFDADHPARTSDADIERLLTEHTGKRLVTASTRPKNKLQKVHESVFIPVARPRPKRSRNGAPKLEEALFDENPLDATMVINVEDDKMPTFEKLRSEFYGLPLDILEQAANRTNENDRQALFDWLSWAQIVDKRALHLFCAGVEASAPLFRTDTAKSRAQAAIKALGTKDISFSQAEIAERLNCSVSTVSRQVTRLADVRGCFGFLFFSPSRTDIFFWF